MPSLLVISSAPAKFNDGKATLDIKFVEGMRLYSATWEGHVGCMLEERNNTFPFSQNYELDQLPFMVTFIPENQKIQASDIAGYDIILCSGDNHQYLHLGEICHKTGQKLIFIIEYIVETRIQTIFLEYSKSFPKKIYSVLWMLNQERRRRRAFRLADGIQANGYPAFNAYKKMNINSIMYLDSRIGEQLLATPDEMKARYQRIMRGERLKLIHSGRLEPMKGSHDLIPIARQLIKNGTDFELHIFGSGSLEPEILKGIEKYDLHDRVFLNGVVDFESELVPFARTNADIYLSCHRQSDPSCTYLESMGCGLAIVGYANRMWSALCEESGAGWAAPLGKIDKLAEVISNAANDLPKLVACCESAHRFASTHSFEHEYKRRIDNLKAIV